MQYTEYCGGYNTAIVVLEESLAHDPALKELLVVSVAPTL